MADERGRGNGFGSALRKPFTISNDIERALDEALTRIVQPIEALQTLMAEYQKDLRALIAQLQVDVWEELPYRSHTRLRTTQFVVCSGPVASAADGFQIFRGGVRLIGPFGVGAHPLSATGIAIIPIHTIVEPSQDLTFTVESGLLASVYVCGKAD
jgi:hypothetical protein